MKIAVFHKILILSVLLNVGTFGVLAFAYLRIHALSVSNEGWVRLAAVKAAETSFANGDRFFYRLVGDVPEAKAIDNPQKLPEQEWKYYAPPQREENRLFVSEFNARMAKLLPKK
jgi:hypothetical protein